MYPGKLPGFAMAAQALSERLSGRIAPVLDSNEATTDLGALLTMNFLYGLANQ